MEPSHSIDSAARKNHQTSFLGNRTRLKFFLRAITKGIGCSRPIEPGLSNQEYKFLIQWVVI